MRSYAAATVGAVTIDSVRVVPVPFGGDWRAMRYAFFFGVDSSSDTNDAAWAPIRWPNTSESAPRESGASRVGGTLDELGALTANAVDPAALGDPDAFTAPQAEALGNDPVSVLPVAVVFLVPQRFRVANEIGSAPK